MMERIEAWLRARDAARFQAEMNKSAASVERVGTAGKKAAGGLASMSSASVGAAANLKKAGLVMDATGRKMAGAGTFLTHNVTRPILAIGAASAWMSAKFSQDMTLLETQAGAPRGEIEKLRGQVLGLAKDSTFGPDELAKGLFHLESIGLRGAKAMDTLKIASQGAMVGNADLEAVTTALGSAWIVNIKGAGNLRHVMAILNATVGAGNTRMENLVEALGTGLLPASKVAGLGIKDVMGAMALFTDEGYAASSAAAQFSTALHFLYNPTDKARKAMESMGLDSNQLARDMRKPQGLLLALRDLHKHMDMLPGGAHGIQAEQVLGDILPGGRGRIMLTLLNQLDRYKMKMDQIERTSGRFGKSVKQSQETPLNRLKKAWSSVQVSLVKMGDVILPQLVPFLEKMADYVTAIFGAFDKLDPSTKKYIITILAMVAVLGPMLKLLGLFTRGAGLLMLSLGKLVTFGRYVLLRELPTTMVAAETAAATQAGVGGTRLGRLFGSKFMLGFTKYLTGVGIASIIANIIGEENMDPLLFLHPPNAGDKRPGHGDIQSKYEQKHRTLMLDQLARRNNFKALERQVKRGTLNILTDEGIPMLPGQSLAAIQKEKLRHRRRLRDQHRHERRAARNIFNQPGLTSPMQGPAAIGPYTGGMIPLQPIPPQWFDRGERTIIIPLKIDGKEVARAVAKDTADNVARR